MRRRKKKNTDNNNDYTMTATCLCVVGTYIEMWKICKLLYLWYYYFLYNRKSSMSSSLNKHGTGSNIMCIVVVVYSSSNSCAGGGESGESLNCQVFSVGGYPRGGRRGRARSPSSSRSSLSWRLCCTRKRVIIRLPGSERTGKKEICITIIVIIIITERGKKKKVRERKK